MESRALEGEERARGLALSFLACAQGSEIFGGFRDRIREEFHRDSPGLFLADRHVHEDLGVGTFVRHHAFLVLVHGEFIQETGRDEGRQERRDKIGCGAVRQPWGIL